MTNTHKFCLVCNSPNLKPLENYQKAHLVKCNNCGFVFCGPIPSLKELDDCYDRYERNDYLSKVTIKRYNELLDRFEPYRKTNKLLDVGCGVGYFLEAAKKRGWEVYGTEYTDQAMDICNGKGIKMNKGKLDPSHYELGAFDIVTSFEVLEHINNPMEEVKNFYKTLRSGGLLYFTTPNFNAFERYYLKESYNIICYPEHLSYYTKSTMNRLLSDNGFEKKDLLTTGISLTRIKTSKKTSDEKIVQSNNSDDKIRNLTEDKLWAKAIKNIINALLNVSGLGNSLKGYYIRK
jgi:SAM-dependent methyltransferase